MATPHTLDDTTLKHRVTINKKHADCAAGTSARAGPELHGVIGRTEQGQSIIRNIFKATVHIKTV